MKPAVTAIVTLALLAGCSRAPGPHQHVDAPDGHWISLFNGRNLEGWTPKIAGFTVNDNYADTFRVEDGILKVSYQHYDHFDNRFGSLFYERPFSHYWLRVQYRFTGAAAPGAPRWTYKNSGLQLHSQAPATMRKDQSFPVSVEFDLIGGWIFGSRPTGNVCQNGTHVLVNEAGLSEQCSKVSDITVRDDRWVTALAQVDGDRIRDIIDGNLVVEATNATLDDGNADALRLIHAGASRNLTSGYISLQSNGYPVEFRSIEILPIGEQAQASAPAGLPAAP